jgi:ribosomal protein L37AE/L43A
MKKIDKPFNASSQKGWLMIAAEETGLSGPGYDDLPSKHYSWDSNVPCWNKPSKGDTIVLWDKHQLLGIGRIERIDKSKGIKVLDKCPNCNRAAVRPRKKKLPPLRCDKCKSEFEKAIIDKVEVTKFISYHEETWVDLRGYMEAKDLRNLCLQPSSQLSIRELDLKRFLEKINLLPCGKAWLRLSMAHTEKNSGGHRNRNVRVRIGQQKFRKSLLNKYGEFCAFSGSAPQSVLEAAHLYSYATEGKHEEDGGLLIRRDLHRLFDLGQLAINPATDTIDVNADLLTYQAYAALHRKPISVKISAKMRKWILRHWETHRSAYPSKGTMGF